VRSKARGRNAEVRKTVALTTLNGVVGSLAESPEKWQLLYFDDELSANVEAAAAESDTTLLGRRTYEKVASFWPGYAPATR
jgi:dihydrofolate reductase